MSLCRHGNFIGDAECGQCTTAAASGDFETMPIGTAAELERLRDENGRLKQACDIFEKNSADAIELEKERDEAREELVREKAERIIDKRSFEHARDKITKAVEESLANIARERDANREAKGHFQDLWIARGKELDRLKKEHEDADARANACFDWWLEQVQRALVRTYEDGWKAATEASSDVVQKYLTYQEVSWHGVQDCAAAIYALTPPRQP